MKNTRILKAYEMGKQAFTDSINTDSQQAFLSGWRNAIEIEKIVKSCSDLEGLRIRKAFMDGWKEMKKAVE